MRTDWEKFSYPRLAGLLAEKPTRLSQAMHNAGYRELGLPFCFVAFPTASAVTAISAMRDMRIRGYSVTIPFKEAVMPLLDELDEHATAIGAVNTIVNSGDQLCGYNTDWIGFQEACHEAGFSLDKKKVLLFGAGGAGRAAIYACKKSHAASITIANRDDKRSAAVAKSFGVKSIEWRALSEHPFEDYDLIVNSTPIGAAVQQLDYPFSFDRLSPKAAVFDLVTKETPLTSAARAAGALAIMGPRMLLFQALEQFRLFTEVEPPKAAMDAALLDALAGA